MRSRSETLHNWMGKTGALVAPMIGRSIYSNDKTKQNPIKIATRVDMRAVGWRDVDLYEILLHWQWHPAAHGS